MIGEYERAFYGSQYPLMAPLFEHFPGGRGCAREHRSRGVHLRVNAANRRALGFYHHLGFTGLRTGQRHILGMSLR